ncbi:MAG: hypothetical protein J6B10_08025 [Lachnospiraceae bacterium]|nr:hypothetical protein [Lachnospiraceae bacterium]
MIRSIRRARFEFKGTKGAIIFVVLLVMVIAYYFYLSNFNKPVDREAEADKITAVQNVLLRNLETDYPPTPKEVMKYYSELTKCFYNEKLTEEELERLAERAKELYDDELNANNVDVKYIPNLKEDIAEFNEKSIKIANYALPASTEVEYFTMDGREYARMYCNYSIRQGKELIYSREVFLLRRAEDDRWKILGWDLTDEE